MPLSANSFLPRNLSYSRPSLLRINSSLTLPHRQTFIFLTLASPSVQGTKLSQKDRHREGISGCLISAEAWCGRLVSKVKFLHPLGYKKSRERSRNCGDLTALGGEFAIIPHVPHALPPDSAVGGAARRSIIRAAATPAARIPLLTG